MRVIMCRSDHWSTSSQTLGVVKDDYSFNHMQVAHLLNVHEGRIQDPRFELVDYHFEDDDDGGSDDDYYDELEVERV